jgi:hypothetical protein
VLTRFFVDPREELEQDPEHEWRTTIMRAFYRRIGDRQKWLSQLHSDLRELPFEVHEDSLISDALVSIKPDGLVFDDVTPFLRQHMPPFTVTISSHQVASAAMKGMIQAMDNLEILGNDLLSWQIATKGRAWLEKDLSIVRSRYKVSCQ